MIRSNNFFVVNLFLLFLVFPHLFFLETHAWETIDQNIITIVNLLISQLVVLFLVTLFALTETCRSSYSGICGSRCSGRGLILCGGSCCSSGCRSCRSTEHIVPRSDITCVSWIAIISGALTIRDFENS